MEKKGAAIKLPPGFRFHPTDEELVAQYLKRKVLSCPLPATIMPDIQLSSYDPWEIPAGGAVGCGETERYFFHLRKGNRGKNVSRAAGSGYWKVTGKERRIVAGGGRQAIGVKKVMVFHRGKPSNGSRTDWVLHEYCLTPNQLTAGITHMGDWVLCRVFRKERSTKDTKMSKVLINQGGPRNQTEYVDFMKQANQHVVSPDQEMESSCVTQNSDDDEEDNSSFSAATDREKKIKTAFTQS